MNSFTEMLTDLHAYRALGRDLLTLAERESQSLQHAPGPGLSQIYESRKLLLPRLNESLEKIRAHRSRWQTLTSSERQQQPELNALIRQVQDLIMRVILLDRQNEQCLLRRGLVPAREMANVSANQQRPNFVASLYQRQSVRAE